MARERLGRGRKATKRKHWARTIVEVTLHTTPEKATHWSQRSLAEHLGVSKSLVELVQAAGADEAVRPAATVGADEAGGPAYAGEVVVTGLLGTEAGLELGRREDVDACGYGLFLLRSEPDITRTIENANTWTAEVH